MIELLQPSWPTPKGVSIAFTTRRQKGLTGSIATEADNFGDTDYGDANLGLHVGDHPASVVANRLQLLNQLTGVQSIQWLNQTHGTDCLLASAPAVLDADACYTAEPGMACAVMTADCLPVLFACQSDAGASNNDHAKVAAAHAGWRGLANGVLENTLSRFADPACVVAYLGPAIGPQQFEVGPDVRAAFAAAPDDLFTPGQGDRLYANIYGLARWVLAQQGVEQVYAYDGCTVSEPDRFYSYRRNSQTGRQASVIWFNDSSR
ncbi:peptidoglycan editing factor PgeF [Oceanobacter kriegii]|uniref:peptidoglycan editing factor PgeF n=1 Tax=Oceanobacter kriegii TaxID=64972 RepID=UPI00041A845C|nr:peptidoglycan editing factor PgeF [Oceanobacter kriegii]